MASRRLIALIVFGLVLAGLIAAAVIETRLPSNRSPAFIETTQNAEPHGPGGQGGPASSGAPSHIGAAPEIVPPTVNAARVAPTGDAVFAGTAGPRAKVD